MKQLNNIIFLIIRNFTFLGNMFPQLIVCLLLLKLDFRSGYYVTGLWGWSYVVNSLIKNSVRKPRPDPSKHKVNVSGFSFPSGHSLTSLVIYFSVAKYFDFSPEITTALYVVPFLLGLSRLYLRVHDPIDVLGGWSVAYLYLTFAEGFINHINDYFYDAFFYCYDLIMNFINL